MSTRKTPANASDGLYWYMVPGMEPEPVLINHAKYGKCIKRFDGTQQASIGAGERLVGPVLPTQEEQFLLDGEGAGFM